MHIPNPSLVLPRRTFLRGVGAMIALPFLEAMLPTRGLAAATAKAWGSTPSGAPRRMVFFYLPNGMDMENWNPKGTGAQFELASTMQPLAAFKQQLQVLSGLAHVHARPNGDGAGDHARANACYLTGAQPRKTSGADIKAGISADQFAAQQIGTVTRLPSLEMSCEASLRQAGSCDSGYACAYQNNIAWRDEKTPMPSIGDPRLVFERLFSNEEDPDLAAGRALRESCRGSILDLVREDAKAFQRALGQTDRQKMDEYLTALRETEVAIQQQEKFKKALPRPSIPKPDGIPGDFGEHVRIMYDLLALSLQTDSTRIATMMVQHDGSNRPYPFIGVNDGHHDLSHHGNSPEKKAKIAKINKWHMEQFAYFLGKLKAAKEGSGTLLDNCMIVCGSGIADGDRHAHHDLPILLAGGGGGALTPGRHVVFPKETPMTNLFLSLFDRMTVKAERFGDSTGRLENI